MAGPHGPYELGYTCATMDRTKSLRVGDYHIKQRKLWKLIYKSIPNSDWSLQLGIMKSKSLVIVDQNATVNMFSGLVHTARRAMEVATFWKRNSNL